MLDVDISAVDEVNSDFVCPFAVDNGEDEIMSK